MYTTRIVFSILLFLSLIQPLHAYIDPGTGSMIVQLIIAGSVASLYTIKVYWKKIKSLFARNTKKK